MFGAIKTGLGIVKGGIDLVLGRQRRKEREAHEQAGRNAEALEQQEQTDEAQERMDDVKPSGVRGTRERLRGGWY